MGSDKKWILLNVGGTIFKTTRSTLAKSSAPSSPLFRISSCSTNVEWDRDETGAYCIDRDPIYFQPVLNYLRHGRLILNHNVSEEGVLLEAEHFNIPELCKLIRQRITCNHFRAIKTQQLQQQYAFEALKLMVTSSMNTSGSSTSSSSTPSAMMGSGNQHIKLTSGLCDDHWLPMGGNQNSQHLFQHRISQPSASMNSIFNEELMASHVNRVLSVD